MDEVPQEGSWVIYSVFQYSWSIESLDLSDSKANPPFMHQYNESGNLEKAEEAVKSHLLHQGTGQLQTTVAPSCKSLLFLQKLKANGIAPLQPCLPGLCSALLAWFGRL